MRSASFVIIALLCGLTFPVKGESLVDFFFPRDPAAGFGIENVSPKREMRSGEPRMVVRGTIVSLVPYLQQIPRISTTLLDRDGGRVHVQADCPPVKEIQGGRKVDFEIVVDEIPNEAKRAVVSVVSEQPSEICFPVTGLEAMAALPPPEPDSSMEVREVNFEKGMKGDQPILTVSGTVVNRSDEPRERWQLIIWLNDENDIALQEHRLTPNRPFIAAKEIRPFRIEFQIDAPSVVKSVSVGVEF